MPEERKKLVTAQRTALSYITFQRAAFFCYICTIRKLKTLKTGLTELTQTKNNFVQSKALKNGNAKFRLLYFKVNLCNKSEISP